MGGSTAHYGLYKISSGDNWSDNSYQFSTADRDRIDQLLWLGAEGHHHTGAANVSPTGPAVGPQLTLFTTGGNIPAGVRLWYKFSYVDAYGNETVASPEVYLDTPPQIQSPNPATITTAKTGGTLNPGPYYYVLTAYKSANTSETKALNPCYISVPVGTSTNTNTLTLPTLPANADGFNVYRKAPGSLTYYYVTSVPMNVVTPPTVWVDTGSIAENCARTVPVVNSTLGQNAVTISLPGATPTVPVGNTWRLYRTTTHGDWTNTLLHWVVENTTQGSGIITPTYTDLGFGTGVGQPASAGQSVGTPAKVDLKDGNEVQNTLPMGLVAGFPYVMTFSFAGTIQPVVGKSLWTCEFPKAQIIGCRATLGNGSTPASQNLIVDIFKGMSSATPTETSIYTTTGQRPQILPGQTVGVRTVPNIVNLLAGDVLRCDVIQSGGGATPSDHDLTVNVYMWVFGFPTTSWIPSF